MLARETQMLALNGGMALHVRLVIPLALSATSCLAFARGQAGMAFGTSEKQGHSGPIVSAEGVFRPPSLSFIANGKPLPVALQTSVEALLAPERKDFAWGTGLGLISPLVPIGGQVIVGTNAHVGIVDGKTELGGISPYVDLGVRAPLSPDAVTARQTFLSLDLTGQTYFNFLHATPAEQVVCVKFGFGWGD